LSVNTAAALPPPQGVCDGMTYAEIAQKFPEDYEARKRDKLRYR